MHNRCPKCKHGQHKKHVVDYVDKDGVVRLCKCVVCVPTKASK